jgi:hypothetical protein
MVNVMSDKTNFTLPLDDETVERLMRFSAAAGRAPVEVATALLSELLADDELAHVAPVRHLN